MHRVHNTNNNDNVKQRLWHVFHSDFRFSGREFGKIQEARWVNYWYESRGLAWQTCTALSGWSNKRVFWSEYIGRITMTSWKWKHFPRNWPLCGEFIGPGEFPTQRPVTRSFDVFFDLRLNERLSKQPWGWWFETLSWSLWRHCNVKR